MNRICDTEYGENFESIIQINATDEKHENNFRINFEGETTDENIEDDSTPEYYCNARVDEEELSEYNIDANNIDDNTSRRRIVNRICDTEHVENIENIIQINAVDETHVNLFSANFEDGGDNEETTDENTEVDDSVQEYVCNVRANEEELSEYNIESDNIDENIEVENEEYDVDENLEFDYDEFIGNNFEGNSCIWNKENEFESFFQNSHKIHPNLNTTISEVLIMLNMFYVRHNLTLVGLTDLAIMINSIIGAKILPESKYIIKKTFSKALQLKTHFYCANCNYVIDDNLSEFCHNCKLDIDLTILKKN